MSGDEERDGLIRDGKEGRSIATALVKMARDRYTFGVSTVGEAFAVPIDGPPVVRLLRGGGRDGLRNELAFAYFEDTGRTPGNTALADAMSVVEGIASYSETVPLAQRVANSGGTAWIDLGDSTGEAIRVDADGWNISVPPVRFKRTALTAPLPRPMPGGELAELWRLLNVAETDQPLLLAWLVLALMADVPHPVLAFFGEQGTGKSTAAKIVSSLLDPSPAQLRKAPRDADSWVTAASGSWIVPLDNISAIPAWLSDSLCRAVTGDGDVRRQLYTDGALAVFAFRRAVVLTGIDPGAQRGDLADRLLVIDLEVIGESHRRLDEEVADRWRDAHPRVLGALLDLAVRVEQELPTIQLPRSPRMADYARVLAAVDNVLGTAGMHRYMNRSHDLAAEALTDDLFITAFAAQVNGIFEGSSAQLLELVAHGEPRAPAGWPTNPRAATGLLMRQAPVMRKAGWRIGSRPNSHDHVTVWTIRAPEHARIPEPQHSHHAPAPLSPVDRGPANAALAGTVDEHLEASANNSARLFDASVARVAGQESEASPAAGSNEMADQNHPAVPRDAVILDMPAVTDYQESGACVRCGTATTRYGRHGRPLCDNCGAGPGEPDARATAPAVEPAVQPEEEEVEEEEATDAVIIDMATHARPAAGPCGHCGTITERFGRDGRPRCSDAPGPGYDDPAMYPEVIAVWGRDVLLAADQITSCGHARELLADKYGNCGACILARLAKDAT
jgi:hypothetical protein